MLSADAKRQLCCPCGNGCLIYSESRVDAFLETIPEREDGDKKACSARLVCDWLLQNKPSSTLQILIPANSLRVTADDLHSESIATAVQLHSTFLTESCIKSSDYILKCMLVVRDNAEAEHLLQLLRYLRSDIPIDELFSIIVQVVPTSCLLPVLNEILHLFEHTYRNSSHFKAARKVLEENKLNNAEKVYEIQEESASPRFTKAIICLDNNMLFTILTGDESSGLTQESLEKALEFSREKMHLPECLLEFLEMKTSL